MTDRANFPTDRYVLEGLARDRDREIALAGAGPVDGPSTDEVAAVLAPHAERRRARDAQPRQLPLRGHRRPGRDHEPRPRRGRARPVGPLALGGLGAGRVSPSTACRPGRGLHVQVSQRRSGRARPSCIIRSELQAELRNPIQGWFGQADQFEMGQGFRPRPGIAGWLTGTPGILGLAAAEEGIRVSPRPASSAIRAKGIALTEYAIALHDAWLAPLGFALGVPRDAARRGAHVSIRRDGCARSDAPDDRGRRDPGLPRAGLDPAGALAADDVIHGRAQGDGAHRGAGRRLMTPARARLRSSRPAFAGKAPGRTESERASRPVSADRSRQRSPAGARRDSPRPPS